MLYVFMGFLVSWSGWVFIFCSDVIVMLKLVIGVFFVLLVWVGIIMLIFFNGGI